MAWAGEGRLLVSVHGPDNPSVEEWNEYVEWVLARETPLDQLRTLVRSYGGGPSAVQRAQLTDRMSPDGKSKVVLLTDSLLVRGVGVAMSWFNPALRILGPQQVDEALDYLELDGSEAKEARRLLERLGDAFHSGSRNVGT